MPFAFCLILRMPCAKPVSQAVLNASWCAFCLNLPNRVKISGVFVTFGEHQVTAQLIAKSVLIAPLIPKDFPVRHPLLARGHVASVTLNHQK
jgi:hypothetical protein